MYLPSDLQAVEERINSLLKRRDALAIEIAGAFASRRRILKVGVNYSPPVNQPQQPKPLLTNPTNTAALKQELTKVFSELGPDHEHMPEPD